MRKMRMKDRVRRLLESNPGKTWTYGEIARRLGSHPRAIGACMSGLGNDGFELCGNVVMSRYEHQA